MAGRTIDQRKVGIVSPIPVLPDPVVYEQEYDYWPWGQLLSEAIDILVARIPPGGFVIDYMCGTGYLLDKVLAHRPDVRVLGCDISEPYVRHGRSIHPLVHLVESDARYYAPSNAPDVVICTAGLHHLCRPDQLAFLQKVAGELGDGGQLIIGEELISSFATEAQRRQAVAQLGLGVLSHVLVGEAPPAIIEAAMDMFTNDLLERGEYKSSQDQLIEMLSLQFVIEETKQIWPDDCSSFGDFLLVCRKK